MNSLEQLLDYVLIVETSYINKKYWVTFNIEGKQIKFCDKLLETSLSRGLAVAESYGKKRCKTKI